MGPGQELRHYAIKNYEHHNQATQRTQELEEEAAKYKQRFRGAGIQVTPKKKELPIQDGSPEAASSSSNQGPQGGVPAIKPLQPSQDPPQKRRPARGRQEELPADARGVLQRHQEKWSGSTNQHDLP